MSRQFIYFSLFQNFAVNHIKCLAGNQFFFSLHRNGSLIVCIQKERTQSLIELMITQCYIKGLLCCYIFSSQEKLIIEKSFGNKHTPDNGFTNAQQYST